MDQAGWAALLKDWRQRIDAYQGALLSDASSLRRRYYLLGLPVTALTAITGTTTFSNLDKEFAYSARLTVVVISLLAAVLSAAHMFYNFGERAERSRSKSDQLGGLRRQIDILLSFPPPSDQMAVKLTELNEAIGRVSADAPLLSAPSHGTIGSAPGSQVLLKDAEGPSLPSASRLPIGTPVTVPDDRLRFRLLREFGRVDGELGDLELASLATLDLRDTGITNLTGLEHCRRLTILSLENNSVTDLVPLAGLKDLQVLSINLNPIQDLRSIRELTSLTEFYAGKTAVDDLSALEGMLSLRTVSLPYAKVEDVASLIRLRESGGLAQAGSSVLLWSNPLSARARNVQIPMLLSLGVDVKVG